MAIIEDGNLKIVTAGPAGFGNNIYVVIDKETNEAAFIDAPAEPEQSIAAAEGAGVRPSAIILTHGHGDHTASIDILKQRYGAKLYAAGTEVGLKPGQLDVVVSHGDDVPLGNLRFRALHVPGHTPGSTTYVAGKSAFVGDTLFPGGPGHSRSSDLLQQEIASITTQLFALPDDTVLYPGHGDTTTIAASKAEYAVFAGKEHPGDLHGDVNWLES
jgi:glyoxylase-like metal-dependent hydrolase (beta-lactamase superfamily II)